MPITIISRRTWRFCRKLKLNRAGLPDRSARAGV
jgi:hypothetical protein